LEDTGRKLQVGTVVEGSLLTRGNDVRINLNVIKVADGSQLWSGAFNRKLDDVFDLQEEIAIAVAEALRAELGIAQTKSGLRLARYRTQDVRAYELMVKVDSMLGPITNVRDKDLMREIKTLVDEALLIDSNYPDALYQKGRFYFHSNKPEQAKAIADQLFAADGENGFTLSLLAQLAEREMKWEEALAHVARTVELVPWNGPAHVYYGSLLQRTFQLEEGLQHMRRAAQLGPLNPFNQFVLGGGESAVGNYEKASDQFYLATELGHSDPAIPLLLARSLYLSGRKVEAASSMLDWVMSVPTLRSVMLNQPDITADLEAGDMTSMLKFFLARESACSNGDYLMVWYAEFDDRDGLFRCVTDYLATDNVKPIGILHDISLRPYLHDERMKPLLKACNLLAYLPKATVSEGVQ
jgi:tetratricopeptide (TPR) repeat protein